MNQKRIKELINVYRDGLLQDTLPFWMNHFMDKECGGFFNFLDRDGTVLSTDKSVWGTGRVTWLFATLYNNVEKKTEWLATAKHGLDFLEKHCFDSDGRMFFEVTRDGRPLRKRRYVYSEYFGILALSEYSIATGDEKAAKKAEELYDLMLRYSVSPGLLAPKLNPQVRQVKGHAMAMVQLSLGQQLRRINLMEKSKTLIDHCLREIFNDFMKYDEQALLETVGVNGERLDSPEGRCINPGHAIETAWFLLEEGRYRQDREIIDKACLIIDWSLEKGWDRQRGGIYYFVDVEGKACEQYEHDMKLAWPHNEALYACLLAYHLTGDKKYADWHDKIHEWAYAHFPDRTYGDWFKYLHYDGTVSHRCKGNRWEGPYHLPRMQLNCWKLLEQSISVEKGLTQGKI